MTAGSKYIVIGATGFIGSAVGRELISMGQATLLLGSKECDLLNVNSVDQALSGKLQGATLIVASGISRLRGDSMDEFTMNLVMLTNLIQVCQKETPEQVIYLSSVEVYGNKNLVQPITEDTPCRPERLYGISKVAGEQLWRWWGRQTGKTLKIMRLPGVYGPGDKGRGFIGMLAEAIKRNVSVKLSNKGKDLRDYIFVNDVAKAVVQFGDTPCDDYQLVNLARGTSLSIADITEEVFKELGRCPLTLDKAEEESTDLVFDTTNLNELLPHLEFTPLNVAVRRYRSDYNDA